MDAICIQENLSETHCSVVGLGLGFTYIILGIAALLAIVLPLISSLNNPKALLKVLAGVGVLVVVFLICYAISSDSPSDAAKALGLGTNGYRLVGAGLTMFYVVFVIAFGAMLVNELSSVKSVAEVIKILIGPIIVILALSFGVDGGLYLTYGIMILVAVALVYGIVVSAGSGKTERWRVAYWLGFFLILGGISYVLSGNEVKPMYKALGVDAGQSKLVGAGLITFYLALLAAIVGVIYSEINKALK